jgi:hypothetical protein
VCHYRTEKDTMTAYFSVDSPFFAPFFGPLAGAPLRLAACSRARAGAPS